MDVVVATARRRHVEDGIRVLPWGIGRRIGRHVIGRREGGHLYLPLTVPVSWFGTLLSSSIASHVQLQGSVPVPIAVPASSASHGSNGRSARHLARQPASTAFNDQLRGMRAWVSLSPGEP